MFCKRSLGISKSIHTSDNIISFRKDNAVILNYDKQSLFITLMKFLFMLDRIQFYPATGFKLQIIQESKVGWSQRICMTSLIFNWKLVEAESTILKQSSEQRSDNFQKLLGAAVFKFPGQTSQFIPFTLISFLA